MSYLKSSVICLAMYICSSAYSVGITRDVKSLKDGTYVGYLTVDLQGSKIPAILEISKGPYPWLNDCEASFAVLKILFGGFQSHEYLTQFFAVYHHKNLTFDATFDGNGPDTSLLGATITEDGKEIKAKVSTILGGSATGKATFRYLEPGQSTLEVLKGVETKKYTLPSVSDEYVGICNGSEQNIQLESRRNYSNKINPHVPFYGYNVISRIGRKPTVRRIRDGRDENASYVFNQSSRHVSYNYYSQKISIPGIGTHCDFNKEGISCSETCSFKRRNKFQSLLIEQDYKLTVDENIENKSESLDPNNFDTTPLKDRSGFYYGYMFLNNTSRYETVIMEVSSNKTIEGREYLRLEGTVHIASGPINTATYIPFRFKPTTLEGDGQKPFLLISDEDQFVKVNKWKENNLTGTWYSKSFGRVGTFNLQKKIGGITPECKVKISSELAGHYTATKNRRTYTSSNRLVGAYQESLDLSLTGDFDGIAQPYFPFILTGALQTNFLSMFSGISSSETYSYINKGCYNPFTNSFYAELEGGRTLYGRVLDNKITTYISGESVPGRAFGWDSKVIFRKDPSQ